MTSLYGIIRGQPPKFFDGSDRMFTGLYFHLEDEPFEFYAPLKMKDNKSLTSEPPLCKIVTSDFWLERRSFEDANHHEELAYTNRDRRGD